MLNIAECFDELISDGQVSVSHIHLLVIIIAHE